MAKKKNVESQEQQEIVVEQDVEQQESETVVDEVVEQQQEEGGEPEPEDSAPIQSQLEQDVRKTIESSVSDKEVETEVESDEESVVASEQQNGILHSYEVDEQEEVPVESDLPVDFGESETNGDSPTDSAVAEERIKKQKNSPYTVKFIPFCQNEAKAFAIGPTSIILYKRLIVTLDNKLTGRFSNEELEAIKKKYMAAANLAISTMRCQDCEYANYRDDNIIDLWIPYTTKSTMLLDNIIRRLKTVHIHDGIDPREKCIHISIHPTITTHYDSSKSNNKNAFIKGTLALAKYGKENNLISAKSAIFFHGGTDIDNKTVVDLNKYVLSSVKAHRFWDNIEEVPENAKYDPINTYNLSIRSVFDIVNYEIVGIDENGIMICERRTIHGYIKFQTVCGDTTVPTGVVISSSNVETLNISELDDIYTNIDSANIVPELFRDNTDGNFVIEKIKDDNHMLSVKVLSKFCG